MYVFKSRDIFFRAIQTSKNSQTGFAAYFSGGFFYDGASVFLLYSRLFLQGTCLDSCVLFFRRIVPGNVCFDEVRVFSCFFDARNAVWFCVDLWAVPYPADPFSDFFAVLASGSCFTVSDLLLQGVFIFLYSHGGLYLRSLQRLAFSVDLSVFGLHLPSFDLFYVVQAPVRQKTDPFYGRDSAVCVHSRNS